MVAKIADPGYSFELSSPIPAIGRVSFSELGISILSATTNCIVYMLNVFGIFPLGMRTTSYSLSC